MKNLKTISIFALSFLVLGALASCSNVLNNDSDEGNDVVLEQMMNENYKTYSESALANTSGNKVLFFHASWCPDCRKIEKKLKTGTIPKDLTVFEVDYDNSTDLKKKYEVTTQTTFVQVDNNGNMVKKWVGAKSVEDIVSKLEVVEMKKEEMDTSDKMMKDNMESISKEQTMTDKEMTSEHMSDDMMDEKEEMMKGGIYTDYSEKAVEEASGDIVLFFHADWCPTCVAFDKKVKTETIPDNLTLLKVNYDNSADLKKKYSVLTQTTFVQVDKEGNMIKKWIGGRGIDSIVNKIK